MEPQDLGQEKCVLRDNFLADLPNDMLKQIGSWLNGKSLLTIPQLSQEEKKALDNFSTKDLEASKITLRQAFYQKNVHIINRFIEEQNYADLITDSYLARKFILWAARDRQREIFDALRNNQQIIKLMDTQTNVEISAWALLYHQQDFLKEIAQWNHNIDPEKRFANMALSMAVEYNLPSIMQLVINTPRYTCLLDKESIKQVIVMAVKNDHKKIVNIILANAQVLRSLDRYTAEKVVRIACYNNNFYMAEKLLWNNTIFSLLGYTWLVETKKYVTNNQIWGLLQDCIQDKWQRIVGYR